jgi:hypothetical protein
MDDFSQITIKRDVTGAVKDQQIFHDGQARAFLLLVSVTVGSECSFTPALLQHYFRQYTNKGL